MLNIQHLKSRHASFLKLHHGAVRAATDDAAEDGLRQATTKQGFTHRTGNAKRKTKVKVIRRGGKRVIIRLKNTAKYGAVLEKGSSAHKIRAKPGKALAFMWEGEMTFRKSVNHPGTKPYRFLSRGRNRAALNFKSSMATRMRRAVKSF